MKLQFYYYYDSKKQRPQQTQKEGRQKGFTYQYFTHLIVVDPEVSLLAPEVPLHDRPALKPYKQLQTRGQRRLFIIKTSGLCSV